MHIHVNKLVDNTCYLLEEQIQQLLDDVKDGFRENAISR